MPKLKKKKKGGMAGLSAAQKEVYRRGLAAYMSSGNRPKVSQHAWAMARVKSDFGKKEPRQKLAQARARIRRINNTYICRNNKTQKWLLQPQLLPSLVMT